MHSNQIGAQQVDAVHKRTELISERSDAIRNYLYLIDKRLARKTHLFFRPQITPPSI